MGQVLVLGGTAWLGREIAARAIESGHSVTCLARGGSGQVPPGALHVVADRSVPGAYNAVTTQRWDEVIDVSYDVGFVTGALDALAERADHWTYVSSVSVYASASVPGANEDAEILEPVDLTDYGQVKVACERATTARLGEERTLIVRPGLIGGPGDGSDRLGYWPARLATAGAGQVLVPDWSGRSVQVVDARDLASWIVAAGTSGRVGVVDATGDPVPAASWLARVAAVTGFTGEFVVASDEWLTEHEVRFWSGPGSLPLWTPAEDAGFMQRDNTRFRAAGYSPRDLDRMLIDVLADERSRGLNRPRRSGMSRQEELGLLALLPGA